jgi:hypothetical protein
MYSNNFKTKNSFGNLEPLAFKKVVLGIFTNTNTLEKWKRRVAQ